MKRFLNIYLDSFKGLSKEVWWLALITLINRAGTMVVPFLSLYLTEDLEFTLSDVGWIMSAFGAGSMVGSWLGGKFTDQIGAYRIMVFSLVASGFMFIGIQYVHDFFYLCSAIFLLVTVADMFRPAMFVALNTYSKPENKTRSVTLIRLAINLGFAAGPALGGLIITGLSYGGLFWVDGITCIIGGLLIVQILNPKKAPLKEPEVLQNPQSPYRDGKFLIFILALLLFALAFMQLFSTLPIYYKDGHHLTELQIGLLFGGNGLIIFIVEMPLVKWLENTGRSKETLMIIGALLVGFSFFIFNLTPWVGILIINLIVVTFGEMILFPFTNAYAMERSNLGNKGAYMALYMMAFAFAHIVSHNAGMQLVDNYGFEVTWYIVTGLCVGSVLLFALLKKMMQNEEVIEKTETE